jgi:hypothetical protein
MRLRTLVLPACACLAAGALAQGASPFDGKWRGTFTDHKGRARQAELLVAGQGGSWTYDREGGKWDNACMGPELPIVVLGATAEQLRLRIDGEKVLKGCGERIVTLKPAGDDRNLVGAFDDNGHEVKFTRK